MVTDADVVISIARDQEMLAAPAPGAVSVQMSTIGVAGIERVKALAEARRPDVTLIDAPVPGSKDPAEQGQLTIFASGPDEVSARLGPLFDALGHRTIWFALSLALKDVHLALEAAGDDRFRALACLADEWQEVVEHGFGDHDLSVVTRALEEEGGAPSPRSDLRPRPAGPEVSGRVE